ncbi:MAG: hypothetical protein ABTS16_14260 [Candidatus Accumulibacter phosphatis]|uniref:GNAT family N-acetyltransferase n=1 Tax=Candidatus Accumulibacter contiguus TaxID=2954381 RepID=A0ABX1T7E3_9PROT|nr:hypothetical protein [Candidatus Accumulibacter contiguus]NMQ04926.1 hypothetical protein [Candidatus Accumulibacter contiguus]
MIARRPHTSAQIVEVTTLDEGERRAMYALYERYYESSSWPLFAADLAGKDRVVLLRDDGGVLQGFSTLAIYQRCFDGAPVRVLFSGDTIVDESQWGQQALAFAWLRLAGTLHAEQPELPLYWLLISKGHRTYRYLPTFSRAFHPSPAADTDSDLGPLKDFLARDRFGEAYDSAAGVVRFAESRGQLRPRYAEVSEAHARLPEVAFFLERNPGYVRGDELVCLCKLATDTLQPIARRAFLAGARTAQA